MTGAVASDWDYVIVGAGAAGGTLAARLAEAGKRVFVLEAGGDARWTRGPGLPDDYDVPGFHAFACENSAMKWDFRVRHYSNEAQQARDFKYDRDAGGVLYPRACGLGGCTTHNAMIFVLPHDSDWDHIAELTGDNSWKARHMRRYARRVESCQYQPFWRALRRLGIDPTGHGWEGWLSTQMPVLLDALREEEMVDVILDTAGTLLRGMSKPLLTVLQWLRRGPGDPNSRPSGSSSFTGLCYTPIATAGHQRVGARERLLCVAAKYPRRLHIELNALATRVLLDPDGTARGVEYLKGERLYSAHANPSEAPGERRTVFARREIILCGGAFNSPQLLMLSGVGPRDELREHGIDVVVDLKGVGKNLQDRYEVAVTFRLPKPWKIMEGARFERGDPVWQRWSASRDGLYASGGVAIAAVRRSRRHAPEPDVFSMALPTRFEGYFPGFSHWIRDHHDFLTWAILKAHTLNRAGFVKLRSSDPRSTPSVNFQYFEPADDPMETDLRALVEAIKWVRECAKPMVTAGLLVECAPGPDVRTDANLADYVRNTTWGHHASCSCQIGPAQENGVLASDFTVHGTRGLRVVDASVFPRIPGLFLVSAVYMIAEKAADTILHATNQTRAGGGSHGDRRTPVTRNVPGSAR